MPARTDRARLTPPAALKEGSLALRNIRSAAALTSRGNPPRRKRISVRRPLVKAGARQHHPAAMEGAAGQRKKRDVDQPSEHGPKETHAAARQPTGLTVKYYHKLCAKARTPVENFLNFC